jgi:predicted nucleic acid-binding protein
MTPDVNVMVAASRSDHPHYGEARSWLEQAVSNAAHGAMLTLQPMVIASFLRLVTHPRVFVQPTPMPDALRFIDALLAAPGVQQPRLVGEWPTLRKLCADKALSAHADARCLARRPSDLSPRGGGGGGEPRGLCAARHAASVFITCTGSWAARWGAEQVVRGAIWAHFPSLLVTRRAAHACA